MSEIDDGARGGRTAAVLASCAAIALAGAGTRLILVNVETRLQIGVFWLIALAIAFAGRGWWRNRSWTSVFLANGVAATIAIVAMRVALEGLPRPLLHLLRHVHG